MNMKKLVLLCGICFVAGCGDVEAQRELVIHQDLSTNNLGKQFDVDVSQLPASWIKSRDVEDALWGKRERLELDLRHRVKVVLIPADEQRNPTTRP